MASTTSPSLLLRIRNPEDGDAWSQFVELYEPIVRTYCYQRKIQKADMDDIVQDVMSTVSRSIRKFEYDPSKGRFRSWFGTVTANKIKSFLSRKDGVRTTTGGNELSDNVYVDPDTDWINIFSEQIFRAACNRIRNDFAAATWASFEGTWVQNKSAADVAKIHGLPIHSVYVNKSRVLKRLEAVIRELADDMPIPRAESRE